jgi:DNA-binding NtrC family response regulator
MTTAIMSKILIADDERSICEAFAEFLRQEGHTPLIASSGEEAVQLVEQQHPDAVFLDIRMPGMDGLAALKAIQSRAPGLPVIVMTAYGTMQTAMDAMRLGAFDYLGKPVDLPQVRKLLRRCLYQPETLPPEDEDYTSEPASAADEMLGQSAVMQKVFKLMSLLAMNDLTLLITGESGAGKELVARGVHAYGPRHEHPFVAINCAAIPEQLLESELFGHEKGAFTGAERSTRGRFEVAANGTLFLDEISELSLPLQSKLLRVLQERSFEPVGSVVPRPVTARLIAASNRHLEDEVQQGRFREDLYHRIKLATIHIPPLRDRKEDIDMLARHFLRQANHELGKQVVDIERTALEKLHHYDWPGNVRELQHTIKRSTLMVRGKLLTLHDLQLKQLAGPASGKAQPDTLAEFRSAMRTALHRLQHGELELPAQNGLFHALIAEAEQEMIDAALKITRGNQVAAAELLGLHRTTMRKKMRQDSSYE